MTKGEKKLRKERILDMDWIVRNLGDEDLLESWLMCGVADGDLDNNSTSEDVDDYYIDSDNYSYITGLFIRIMKRAIKETL